MKGLETQAPHIYNPGDVMLKALTRYEGFGNVLASLRAGLWSIVEGTDPL